MIIKKLQKINFTKVSHNERVIKKCILDNSECPPLTQFAQATFPPGENAPAHCHKDMTEVFFVQSGNGMIVVDDKEISLSAGTAVTVQSGEFHEIINNSTDDLVVLYFGIAH